MRVCRNAMLAFACWQMLLMVPAARAQDSAAGASTRGKELVAAKCFQCHTDAMFRDGRQDRRAWEATIYRMVGRGGLWTADEIRLMADYLGDALGANAKPITPAK
jgi:mono/diheme cytochrome c family protein